jgi:homoserine kinase
LSIAAFDLFPNLLEFKENIESISKLDFFLAGSGSSLFAVSETESIQKAQSDIEAEFSRDDYRMIGSSSMA